MRLDKINLVENKLKALHQDAAKDYLRMGKGIVKSIFRPIQPADFEHAYLPVSEEQGQAFRQMIVKKNSQHIVEFGTSFGISTIYLADAARQTGGKVVTTELLESKAKTALKNLKDAGLHDLVDLRVGDAMETLREYSDPIDFLLLDGWKELYLPLFQMLEPQFHTGTLIYADNIDMAGTRPYSDYVWKKENTYASQLIHGEKAMISQAL